MSRSYKKNSCVSDYRRKVTKYMKRVASKKVRKYKQSPGNGGNYKKLFCSYNIHDYKYLVFKAHENDGYFMPTYGYFYKTYTSWWSEEPIVVKQRYVKDVEWISTGSNEEWVKKMKRK